ncbi:GNAT family N-acetyltransferase [Melghirimyces profundicolus]|nr:GNAT family N-acetyltransferase [Melghirimyces profundicolus]
MGVVKKITAKRRYPDMKVKWIQTQEEIGMHYDLFLSTDEFGHLPENKNEYIKNESKRLENTSDRIAFLSMDNEMVASASTVKEGKKSAIIIGVCTKSKFRNKGYGTEVLIGLFDMLRREGKYPYLFYNNPVARLSLFCYIQS